LTASFFSNADQVFNTIHTDGSMGKGILSKAVASRIPDSREPSSEVLS